MRSILILTVTMLPLLLFAQFSRDLRTDRSGKLNMSVSEFDMFHNVSDRASTFPQQATIFSELDISSYDLLSANLSFSDKDQVQKVVIAPFRIMGATKNQWISNSKLNLSLKDKVTTIGVGTGWDNSSALSKESEMFRQLCFNKLGTVSIPQGATVDDVMQRIADFEKEKLISALIRYDSLRMLNVFKFSTGYNFQLFPVLFAQGGVSNFDSLNHFGLKSHNISGAATYSYNSSQIIVTASYNQIFERKSAEKGQILVPYYGPSINASIRLFKLLSYVKLRNTASFVKSRFIPSLNLGTSWEGKYPATGNNYKLYYKDNITRTDAFTPYVDILITPEAQFRLGFPIIRNEYAGSGDATSMGANIQYNFKISNLGN
ncbi:MAG: hypothetical protein KF744_04180 [Taibaiella sp.]|nr:hypothetical protein [Taibaiella sp.]